MKLIPLTQGKFAKVDDEDYEWLMQWKWHCTHGKYAVRRVGTRAVHRMVYMHRLLANCPDGYEVDHINQDKLDNQKENLRICTHQENSCNCTVGATNTSGYKGVNYHKSAGKWRACITRDHRQKYLGLFTNPEEAARAYDMAAIELHGEFAYLNFQPEVTL